MKMKRINKRSWLAVSAAVCLLALFIECSSVSIQVSAQATTATTSSRAVVPAPKAPATLAELRSRIDEIVRQPALAPGFFAVKIVSLDTGQAIFEQAANKFVRPASNMELY